VELILDQVRAIGSWVQDPVGHHPACAPKGGRMPRQMRLDLAGELAALRAMHAAVLARAELQLRQTGDLMWAESSCRAVLAHRDVWWRERVADCLSALGVQVIAKAGDGMDAGGVLVVEQPDLVVVQDLLPLLSGLQVVRQARRYAPTLLIAGIGAHLVERRRSVCLGSSNSSRDSDLAPRRAGCRSRHNGRRLTVTGVTERPVDRGSGHPEATDQVGDRLPAVEQRADLPHLIGSEPGPVGVVVRV